MIRHQLPARAPLSFGAVAEGAKALLRSPHDPRHLLLNRLVNRHQVAGGLLADSGTSALRLALEALRRWGHDPVALPAFSCYDVATAVAGAGIRARFYDLDPRTLAPAEADLQRALADGARSVVVAPLFGFPVDWDRVLACARDHETVVVEDAAQAHGSLWRGAPAGGFGDLVILSFGRGKGWSAGSGGALLVREAEAAREVVGESAGAVWTMEPSRARELWDLTRSGGEWALGRPTLYRIPRCVPGTHLGETRYRAPSEPGPMGRAAAAMALTTEAAAREDIPVRHRNAMHYIRLLAHREDGPAFPFPMEGGESGYLRFPILLPPEVRPASLTRRALSLGAVRSYPRALPELPRAEGVRELEGLMDTDAAGSDAPAARELARGLVTFPTHGLTTHEDRCRLVELLA